MIRDIEALLEHFKRSEWVWSESGVESILAPLNATLLDTVPGRRTYAVAGQEISVYVDEGRPEFLEVTIDAFLEPHLLSPEEYEQKVDEYFAKYEDAVAVAERILGSPAFNDGGASDGFPEDQEAVWLAQWDLANARLMIQQKHEDKELPIRLCIVVAPPVDVS